MTLPKRTIFHVLLFLYATAAVQSATVRVKIFEIAADRLLPETADEVAVLKDVVNECEAASEVVSGEKLALACVVPDAMIWRDKGRKGLLVHVCAKIENTRVSFRFAYQHAYFQEQVRSGPVDPAKACITTSVDILIGVPIFGPSVIQTKLLTTTGFDESVVILLRTLPPAKQPSGREVTMLQYAVVTFFEAKQDGILSTTPGGEGAD